MSHSPEILDVLSPVLTALVEHELTDDQRATLERLLGESEEARELYVDFMSLHSELKQAHEPLAAQTVAMIFEDLDDPMAAMANALGDDEGELPGDESKRRVPVLGFLADVGHQAVGLLSHQTPFSLFVAAVSIGTLLTLLAMWTRPVFHRWMAQGTVAVAEASVAQLSNAVDVHWSDAQAAVAIGAGLKVDDKIAIEAGLVELTFAKGAKVVVEGPAVCTVESRSGMRLDRGKLAARVKSHAVGFTVTTPRFNVIDLGTEFGVVVDPQGLGDVRVFAGSVQVEIPHADNPAEILRSVYLVAGESVRYLGGDQVAAAPPEGMPRFVLDIIPPQQKWEADENTIPLGNLFDDSKNASLRVAVASDTYRAEAHTEALGLATVKAGGLDQPVELAPGGVRFNLANVGGGAGGAGVAANDACRPHSTIPIRTVGKHFEEGSIVDRQSEGIGMHANGLLTFDLDELRGAGQFEGKPLQLIVDRAGLNDNQVEDSRGNVRTIVILSNDTQVLGGYINGRRVAIVEKDGVFAFDDVNDRIPGELLGNGKYASFNLPVDSNVRYLSLVVTSGHDVTCDHGVFNGARLQILEPDAPPRQKSAE